MKIISKSQFQILQKMKNKYKVPENFFLLNLARIQRFYLRQNLLRFCICFDTEKKYKKIFSILTHKIIGKRKNRIKKKEKQKKKIKISKWRHLVAVWRIKNEKKCVTSIPVENIDVKLRQQLKLLMMGKPKLSTVDHEIADISEPTPSTSKSLIREGSLKRNSNFCDLNLGKINISSIQQMDESRTDFKNICNINNVTPMEIDENSIDYRDIPSTSKNIPCKKEETKTTFFDVLLQKINKSKIDDIEISDANDREKFTKNKSFDISESFGKNKSFEISETNSLDSNQTAQSSKNKKRKFNELFNEDSNNSNGSTKDFYGFNENEIQMTHPKIPGLLATPIVTNSDYKSAFISVDEYPEETFPAVEFKVQKREIRQSFEDGMVCVGSEIPQLECPERPADMEKPRTVAEKRQLLAKRFDVKYMMIDNESTIFRELKKRSRPSPTINFKLIKSIQLQNIPFRRGCWKATSWLSTESGNFYYRTLKIGLQTVKLLGDSGNNKQKNIFVKAIPKIKLKKNKIGKCLPSCHIKLPEGLKFDLTLVSKLTVEKKKPMITESEPEILTPRRMNLFKKSCQLLKPGPLISKCNNRKELLDDDYAFGPFEIYKMPKVQLEVWPKHNKSFDDNIQSYLKIIQPSDNITEEWANFALSALRDNNKIIKEESFTFDIPFMNKQNNILVRKRIELTNKYENVKDISCFSEPLEFKKLIDPNNQLECEIGDYLTEIIDSVAIGLIEDKFIQDDPDQSYTIEEEIRSINKSKPVSTVSTTKKTRGNRILNELKKLNATIIQTVTADPKDSCQEKFCDLGCVCASLQIPKIIKVQCRKLDCMFGCTCRRSTIPQIHDVVMDEALTHEMNILHEKATSRFAKEEKEFSSTIVLTNNSTVFISNTQTENKQSKRCKKIPKKLTGFVVNSSEIDLQIEKKRPKILYPDIELFRHVTVNLQRIPELDTLESWCMVHELYKCFCNGQAVEGTPFSFSEDNNDKSIPITETYTPVRKRNYSFLKDEKVSEKNEPNWDSEIETFTAARIKPVNAKKYLLENRTNREMVKNGIIKKEQKRPELKKTLEKYIKNCFEFAINKKFTRRMSRVSKQKNVLLSPSSATTNESTTNESISQNEKFTDPPQIIYRKSDPILETDLSNKLSNSSENTSLDSSISNSKNTSFNSAGECSTGARIHLDELNKFDNSYTGRINKLNRIVTSSMTDICGMQRRNTKFIPSQTPKCLNSIRWDCLIEAYQEDIVFVWEIKNEADQSILALTTTNKMPIVSNALSIINIKAVTPDHLDLLAKMLNLQIINDKTKNLSVLLFGQLHYWRVMGFMHSKINYLEDGIMVKPTPTTHPELALKISLLYKKLFGVNQNENTKEHELLEEKKNSNSVNSNVEITEIHLNEFQSIFVPIPIIGDHRWFMLNLTKDFSDIYIPSWKSFLKYEKITKALNYATKSLKTVKITANVRDVLPHVYATPKKPDKIFFGPYKSDEDVSIVLCQEMDGRMLLREEYERILKIKRRKHTKGCWLYMKDDKMVVNEINTSNKNLDEMLTTKISSNKLLQEALITDDDSKVHITFVSEDEKETTGESNIHNNDDDNNDDDDCILIEESEINKEQQYPNISGSQDFIIINNKATRISKDSPPNMQIEKNDIPSLVPISIKMTKNPLKNSVNIKDCCPPPLIYDRKTTTNFICKTTTDEQMESNQTESGNKTDVVIDNTIECDSLESILPVHIIATKKKSVSDFDKSIFFRKTKKSKSKILKENSKSITINPESMEIPVNVNQKTTKIEMDPKEIFNAMEYENFTSDNYEFPEILKNAYIVKNMSDELRKKNLDILNEIILEDSFENISEEIKVQTNTSGHIKTQSVKATSVEEGEKFLAVKKLLTSRKELTKILEEKNKKFPRSLKEPTEQIMDTVSKNPIKESKEESINVEKQIVHKSLEGTIDLLQYNIATDSLNDTIVGMKEIINNPLKALSEHVEDHVTDRSNNEIPFGKFSNEIIKESEEATDVPKETINTSLKVTEVPTKNCTEPLKPQAEILIEKTNEFNLLQEDFKEKIVCEIPIEHMKDPLNILTEVPIKHVTGNIVAEVPKDRFIEINKTEPPILFNFRKIAPKIRNISLLESEIKSNSIQPRKILLRKGNDLTITELNNKDEKSITINKNSMNSLSNKSSNSLLTPTQELLTITKNNNVQVIKPQYIKKIKADSLCSILKSSNYKNTPIIKKKSNIEVISDLKKLKDTIIKVIPSNVENTQTAEAKILSMTSEAVETSKVLTTPSPSSTMLISTSATSSLPESSSSSTIVTIRKAPIIVDLATQPSTSSSNSETALKALDFTNEVINLSSDDDNNDDATDKNSTQSTPLHTGVVDTGYVVCNIPNIGKIACQIINKYYVLRLPHMRGTLKMDQLANVSNLLGKFIRQYVYAVIPNHLSIVWRYTNDPKEHKHIREFKREIFSLDMVITECGLIDLKQDLSLFVGERALGFQLHLIQLAWNIIDRTDVRNQTGIDIINRGVKSIKVLKEREKKLIYYKEFYETRLEKNKLKYMNLRKSIVSVHPYLVGEIVTKFPKIKNVKASYIPPKKLDLIVIDDDDEDNVDDMNCTINSGDECVVNDEIRNSKKEKVENNVKGKRENQYMEKAKS